MTSGTFKIGTFFGFDINVHWSWLFIFLLITWTFAGFTLVEIYPEWNAERRWVVGAIISLIFFLSILMHEMSHSIVARKYGLPVGGITLFVFGGFSSLMKEPESPRQEFWIAVVGPLTSYAAAILFAIGYFVLDPIEDGAAAISLHLAVINALIGTFNLVPGFPLDGGRILRSIVWSQKRTRLDATKLSSKVGEFVAYGIMGIGVIMLFAGLIISGIWLLLIGNFLRGAAQASYGQLFVQEALKGVPVSRLAREDYIPVSPDMRLLELAEMHILAGRGRAFPVMAADTLYGLITLTDLRKVPREEWPTTTVYRAMTPFEQLKTVEWNAPLSEVFSEMASGDLNQIPVMSGRTLRGLILRSDLMHYLQVRQELGSATESEWNREPQERR